MVRNYWVGGPLLDKVDPDELLIRLRSAFTGQVTGMLDSVGAGTALAHHSFHVFVIYPWVRFLDRDPTTPLQVMQDCRVRWGVVESVDGDHVAIASAPLTFAEGELGLGDVRAERVRWRKGGASLTPPPEPGGIVAAHWDWVCGSLTGGRTRRARRCDQPDTETGQREPRLNWSQASGAVSRTGDPGTQCDGRHSQRGGGAEY